MNQSRLSIRQFFNNYCSLSNVAKVFTVVIFIVAILSIIIYSIDLYRQGHKKHLIGWISGGGFVFLTIPIAVRLVVQHLSNWQAPRIQKFVVRIIWIIPIYSIESWIALRYTYLNVYMETLREFYESYAVFNFLYYLISLFGDEQNLIDILRGKPESRGVHPFPLNLIFKNWAMGAPVVHWCKLGVLQYVAVKFLITIISMILEKYNLYSEGSFKLDRGYVYICSITNASQIWALYCLVLFYSIAWEELTPWRPISKFLCVKSVVFFTWWQSIAINLIIYVSSHTSFSYRGVHMVEIKGNDEWSQRDIAKAIQDYLICIEMFVAAIAFTFAFPVNEYLHLKSKNLYYSLLSRKETDIDFPPDSCDLNHNNSTSSSSGGNSDNINSGASNNTDGRSNYAHSDIIDNNGGSIIDSESLRSEEARTAGVFNIKGRPVYILDDSPADSKKSKRPFLSALLASASPDEFLDDMKRFLGGQELSSILSNTNKPTLAIISSNNCMSSINNNGNSNINSNINSMNYRLTNIHNSSNCNGNSSSHSNSNNNSIDDSSSSNRDGCNILSNSNSSNSNSSFSSNTIEGGTIEEEGRDGIGETSRLI